MATHSSILAWRIPWTEEPSRQSLCCKESDTAQQLTLSLQYMFLISFKKTFIECLLSATHCPKHVLDGEINIFKDFIARRVR